MVTITKRLTLGQSGRMNLQYQSSGILSNAAITLQKLNMTKQGPFTSSEGYEVDPSGSSPWFTPTYMNFKGITIPKGSVINSAIMTMRAANRMSYTWYAWMRAKNSKGFSLPNPGTSKTSVEIQALARGNDPVGFLTTVSAPNTSDLLYSFSMTQNAGYNGNFPEVISWGIEQMVQALVDKFDYNNDSMFFQINPSGGAGNPSTGSMQMYFYGLEQYSTPNIPSTGRTNPPITSATSQGVGLNTPKLEINFTAPIQPPVLRSCRTVDALLIAKGDIHGRCGDEIYW